MSRPDYFTYFTEADVAKLLTPQVALESQRHAFGALASGTAILAPRVLIDGAEGSTAFSYVARLSPESSAVSKLGSVNPANADRGEPTISATVHVLDAITGHPSATIEAETLTTLRTAAASAVAVEQFAREQVKTLGIIGTGVQARAHLAALLGVRDFTEVRLAGRSLQRTKQLAAELPGAIDNSANLIGE